MFMAPIEPGNHDYRLVRLLRRWAAEREQGGAQLPSLVRLGRRLGLDAQASVAVSSMFQLTEHCLGRPLKAECCCSPRLSPDEHAVLLMLSTAAMRAPLAPASIPHGLPGALCWAVESVRRMLGMEPAAAKSIPRHCPFDGPAS